MPHIEFVVFQTLVWERYAGLHNGSEQVKLQSKATARRRFLQWSEFNAKVQSVGKRTPVVSLEDSMVTAPSQVGMM